MTSFELIQCSVAESSLCLNRHNGSRLYVHHRPTSTFHSLDENMDHIPYIRRHGIYLELQFPFCSGCPFWELVDATYPANIHKENVVRTPHIINRGINPLYPTSYIAGRKADFFSFGCSALIPSILMRISSLRASRDTSSFTKTRSNFWTKSISFLQARFLANKYWKFVRSIALSSPFPICQNRYTKFTAILWGITYHCIHAQTCIRLYYGRICHNLSISRLRRLPIQIPTWRHWISPSKRKAGSSSVTVIPVTVPNVTDVIPAANYRQTDKRVTKLSRNQYRPQGMIVKFWNLVLLLLLNTKGLYWIGQWTENFLFKVIANSALMLPVARPMTLVRTE